MFDRNHSKTILRFIIQTAVWYLCATAAGVFFAGIFSSFTSVSYGNPLLAFIILAIAGHVLISIKYIRKNSAFPEEVTQSKWQKVLTGLKAFVGLEILMIIVLLSRLFFGE